jgi:hypothetical protein
MFAFARGKVKAASKIGELLTEYEFVTAQFLEQALELQAQDAKTAGKEQRKLGEILVALGWIKPRHLTYCLSVQSVLQQAQ